MVYDHTKNNIALRITADKRKRQVLLLGDIHDVTVFTITVVVSNFLIFRKLLHEHIDVFFGSCHLLHRQIPRAA